MENLWRGGAGTLEHQAGLSFRDLSQREQPHTSIPSFQPWWDQDLHPSSDRARSIRAVASTSIDHLPPWFSENLKPIKALVEKFDFREGEAPHLSGFTEAFKKASSPEEAQAVLNQVRDACWNTIRRELPPGSEYPIEEKGGRSRADLWRELFDKEFDKIEMSLMLHFSRGSQSQK